VADRRQRRGVTPLRLSSVWAKSPRGGRSPELLTEHLHATLRAAQRIERRVGPLPGLEGIPPDRFWPLVTWAALLHDTGKVADGFQAQLGNPAFPPSKSGRGGWGERHEVLSLAFVDVCAAALPDEERLWVALGVLTHHRPLRPAGVIGHDRGRDLDRLYGGASSERFAEAFGCQVRQGLHDELVAWVASQAPEPGEPGRLDAPAAERARRGFQAVTGHWQQLLPDGRGLTAVLLQGAVTMADHLSSAGQTRLDDAAPVPPGSLNRLSLAGRQPYAHQVAVARHQGHVALVAPTGTGKTEGMLAWASGVLAGRPGQPRLFYVLPYLASINAMVERLGRDLGCGVDRIGVVHGKAAHALLAWSVADGVDLAAAARKARARQRMTRLFRERLRVGTPYQLLRGALLGAKHTSVLLDAANSVFILDELHAYEPRTFGWLLAALGLWERLGGRIGIASATLAEQVLVAVRESLAGPVAVVRAHPAFSTRLVRHRIRVADCDLTVHGSVDRIREQLAAGRSVLVIANTVRRAQELFAQLAPTATDRWSGDPDSAILLHARFRQQDRQRLEGALRGRYQTYGLNRRGGLLVSTQVAEVSLDVDFDIAFTDVAPLEALLQRMGRVNRVAARAPADVWLHPAAPTRAYLERVGPYLAAPVGEAWRILAAHDREFVDEATAQRWLTGVYAGSWGRQWLADVRDARDGFARDFLTFTSPFDDRSDLEERFDQLFDGAEAIVATDLDAYRAQFERDPLLAAGLLIPLSYQLLARMLRDGRCRPRRDSATDTWVLDLPYSPDHGLDLTAPGTPQDGGAETIL
jgi:CRISPR-associated endonuclease/helicase Cas3